MKRFLVFNFGAYYPAGGWDDLVGSFDTYEEAKVFPLVEKYWQIVDTVTGKVTTDPYSI